MKEMVYLPERLKKPEVLLDTIDKETGFRIIILSLGTHPCAYVGIPVNHPFAGWDCEDVGFIDCHGGITYSREGDGDYLPEGYWWYGWDYAHADDFVGYYKGESFMERITKKWTTKEIDERSEKILNFMNDRWHLGLKIADINKLK